LVGLDGELVDLILGNVVLLNEAVDVLAQLFNQALLVLDVLLYHPVLRFQELALVLKLLNLSTIEFEFALQLLAVGLPVGGLIRLPLYGAVLPVQHVLHLLHLEVELFHFLLELSPDHVFALQLLLQSLDVAGEGVLVGTNFEVLNGCSNTFYRMSSASASLLLSSSWRCLRSFWTVSFSYSYFSYILSYFFLKSAYLDPSVNMFSSRTVIYSSSLSDIRFYFYLRPSSFLTGA
jgi:hypothetical protein